MADKHPSSDPFQWSSEGLGMAVETGVNSSVAHEVLFEDEFTHLKKTPLFLGVAFPRGRFYLAMGIVAAMVIALAGRAFFMQIANGAGYRLRAEENRLRRDVVSAKRGIVFDRDGTVLAENIPSFDLRVVPWLLPRDPDVRDELLGRVGREVNLGLNDIQLLIASSTNPAESMTLLRDIPYERAVSVDILLGNDPALHIATGSKRRYPVSGDVRSLSHLLGYVGAISPSELKERAAEEYRQVDLIGKTGIEAAYERALRGRPGERVFEVDAHNRITTTVGDRPPEDGSDVVLTVSLDLQRAAETALARALKAARLSRGAVVAMDPRDGSILAVASSPAYDDNLFSGTVSSSAYQALLDNDDRPLLPRAWAGMYPSGSTVKPVIATAALAEGVITPETTVNSTGGIKVGGTFFPDWKAGGHGITTVRKALAWSINTFFYYVGGGYDTFIGLGADRLTDWLRRFGLGEKTGLDVPGESAGFVPSKEWKERTKGERWYVGDTYNLSIGQGDLLVTPLQVAAFTAAVANGGYRVTPHLGLRAGLSPGAATVTTSTRASERLADAAIIRVVRQGMRDTVVYGSGRALSAFPVTVAGKTGTAQWRNDRPNHAWFTSFAPYDAPEIVVTVLLEEGGEGSSTAIPVAREVLQAWLNGRDTTATRS